MIRGGNPYRASLVKAVRMSKFMSVLIALLLMYLCVIETVQVFGLYKAVEYAQQELSERE